MNAPTPPAPTGGHGSPFAPFRYPAFRAIWTANLFSNVGSLIQSVGAAWLMTELTKSHLLIAMIQASATIPIMVLGLFAGAIADNYDRRKVMLAAQTAMLAISTLLALLSYQGQITPVSLLLLTFGVGAGTALNGPAWQASVRQQVGPRDLPQAITLNAVAFNLARSVGPALGGLLISLWSISAAFLFNAISYIGMIVVLLRWRPEPSSRQRQPMLSSILTGLSFCAGSVPLRKVLGRGLGFGLGGAAFQSLLPSVARDVLQGTEIDFGLLLAAVGMGSVTAALFVARLRRRYGSENVVTAGTGAFTLATLGMAALAAPHGAGGFAPLAGIAQGMALALLLAFIAGVGWITTLTSLNLAMQVRSPEAILGRCMAIYQAITFGGMAVGAYCWGAVADMFSLPVALYAATAALILTLALRFIAPMPTREEGLLTAKENIDVVR